MSCGSLGSGTVTWTPRELHGFPKQPDLKLSRKLGVDRSWWPLSWWWRYKNYSQTTLFSLSFLFLFHFPSSIKTRNASPKKKSSNFCAQVCAKNSVCERARNEMTADLCALSALCHALSPHLPLCLLFNVISSCSMGQICQQFPLFIGPCMLSRQQRYLSCLDSL